MTPLSDTLLLHLGDFLAEQTGLHFPKERLPDLERGIRQAAGEAGFSNVESYTQHLLAGGLDKKQIQLLADKLTVGETYFFQDRPIFDVLRDRILPALAWQRHALCQLRIWSAGCGTGEEPYSIAILLDRVLPEFRRWNVTILATDINTHFLRKAVEGIYSDLSFRDAPAWLKKNYFTQVGPNRFEILPRIRKLVSFSYLNLAEGKYPTLPNNTNAMDIIFCRNVLMYFKPSHEKMVIQNFHRALMDTGWLVVSMTETSSKYFPPLIPINFDGAILYQKATDPTPKPAGLFDDIFPKPDITDAVVPPEPAFIATEEPKLPEVDPQKTVRENQFYDEALDYFKRGYYSDAIWSLDNEGTLLETSPKFQALVARSFANMGELAEARQWVEKAIAADKMNTGMHYLRAVILQEQGELAEAAQSLKRVLYVDPDFVLAHFALGNQALRQENLQEANKHFANALALLKRYQPDQVLPDSDGLAAGRLRKMIEATMAMEKEA